MTQSTATTHTILHHIVIETSPQRLFEALATAAGVASWWSPMTTESDSTLQVRFGDGNFGPDMRVDTREPDQLVEWTCVEGPWKNMTFRFQIEPHERGCALRFQNEGWPAQDDFFGHCNAKWGFFLATSLKSLLEQGTGHPHPQDPSI